MANGVYIVTFCNFTIASKSYTDKDCTVKLSNPLIKNDNIVIL